MLVKSKSYKHFIGPIIVKNLLIQLVESHRGQTALIKEFECCIEYNHTIILKYLALESML